MPRALRARMPVIGCRCGDCTQLDVVRDWWWWNIFQRWVTFRYEQRNGRTQTKYPWGFYCQ